LCSDDEENIRWLFINRINGATHETKELAENKVAWVKENVQRDFPGQPVKAEIEVIVRWKE
jgi:hypothetical protein